MRKHRPFFYARSTPGPQPPQGAVDHALYRRRARLGSRKISGPEILGFRTARRSGLEVAPLRDGALRDLVKLPAVNFHKARRRGVKPSKSKSEIGECDLSVI